MQGQDLQDLVEGANEWCNIPAPVRAAIRVFNEIIHSQVLFSTMNMQPLHMFITINIGQTHPQSGK